MPIPYKRNSKQFLLATALILVMVYLTLRFGNTSKFKYQPVNKTVAERNEELSLKLDSLFKRANKYQGFNGSVLIAKHGKLIFRGNYGFADPIRKIPLTDTSSFQLASVSKQFTAAAILLLYERGKLSLEDKLIDHIPELPYPEITIKHLLNHTSGLPIYFWYADHAWETDTAPSNDEMIKTMSKTVLPPFFAPGQKFEYSNTGYFLLASIVERVSGITFDEFISKNIFEPLGMEHSFVYHYTEEEKPYQLWGYKKIYRGRYAKIPAFLNDGVVGDKNIFSTTEDLFKWLFGLNNGLILKKETLSLMFTNGKTNSGMQAPYGMGFRLEEDKEGDKLIYHNGRWNGFMNALKMYPEKDLWSIILTNNNFKNLPNMVLKTKQAVTAKT